MTTSGGAFTDGVHSLSAPAPGWTASADVVVVGSGVAGLTTALRVRAHGLRVLLVTKATVSEGSTRWAQGGIAAALADDDSPNDHMADTLEAGGGLCNEEAVRVLVTEGPDAVRELIAWGAHFDTDASGSIALTREGGHHRNRIAHAGGDATGAEVSRALVEAVAADPGIELVENALVLDLIKDVAGRAAGVTLHVIGSGTRDGVGAAIAPYVVLATGGFGQVFGQTTNPYVSTGDGVALALRAGAAVADLEFVQFHPTVLWLGPLAQGQQPLVSEAVRGEGAVLLDDAGERFMLDVHPLADLAPRDVVAKTIMRRMRETGAAHVWLDGRQLGADTWVNRFPTILAECRMRGIDPVSDLIPVAPAQHYASGGVITDLEGHSTIPGLYACGEVACSGVHGANRLASNSLLEGLVFARRIAEAIVSDQPVKPQEPHRPDPAADSTSGVITNSQRRPLQQIMDIDAGVLRSEGSLSHARTAITATMHDQQLAGRQCTEDWETTNLHWVAYVLAAHAQAREETRGSHWREDFPESNPDWRVRLVSTIDASGQVRTQQHPPEWLPRGEDI
ncbi:MAG TPA: L-aspartate oxidase [Candidatus Nanopelagicales bacterium]|nr:L-aspartate oxidase [Candidatus Nanopelagicales bacterium]